MNKPITRDQRQDECVKKWINNKCRGTIVAATGFGKTRVALMGIKKFLNKNPQATVLVVVPTQNLKDQWEGLLLTNGLALVKVEILNSASKHESHCDLLVVDECHLAASKTFIELFRVVKFKIIMCLTATLERLDGRHVLIEKIAPVVDEIPLEECVKNEWVSNYKKFKVLLEVDLTEYEKANKEFYNHFAFFNYNFNLAMSCIGPQGYIGREKFLKEICSDPNQYKETRKIITAHAFGFMSSLQARKKFIANHPKKIEIVNKILECRQDKKAITFSPTIKMAEKIKYGGVLHSKQTKAKRNLSLEEFSNMPTGILNSSKALNQGTDVKGVNLGIILGINSSKTTLIQQIGRVIRYEPNKEAEIFILVLKGTVEETWCTNANGVSSYITIDEEGLDNLLNGRPYSPRKEKSTKMLFRF